MEHFQLYKFLTDLLLVGSIGYLSFRILGNSNLSGKTNQIMILESSLKGLIKDAESAGRALNDELQRRERSLERLLGDLESTEKRATALSSSLAEVKTHIEPLLQQGREIGSHLNDTINGMRFFQQQNAPQLRNPAEEIPEPPMFEQTVIRKRRNSKKKPAEQETRSSLNAQIEREIIGVSGNESAALLAQKVEVVKETTAEAVGALNDLSQQSSVSSQSAQREVEPLMDASPVMRDPRLGVLGVRG